MFNLMLSLVTAAAAGVIDVRTEALFVSPEAKRVLVRVRDAGSIAVLDCPLPAGAVPDLNFDDVRALSSCKDDFLRLPATAEASALLETTFERTLAERVGAEPGRAAILRDSVLIGLVAGVGMSGLFALAVADEFMWMMRTEGKRFILSAHTIIAAVFGTLIGSTQYERRAAAFTARRELGADAGTLPRGRTLLLNVDDETFDFLRDTVAQAVARSAAELEQRATREGRPTPAATMTRP